MVTKDDTFFSSESIRMINKRITSFTDGYRQNLAILGDDREQIEQILHQHAMPSHTKSVVPIYVDATFLGANEFFKNVSSNLLHGILFGHTTNNLNELITLGDHVAPLTTNYIKKVLMSENTISFLQALELINKFIIETSVRCILIINDFTALKTIFKNFHHDFSQFIIFQKKCMVIIASHEIILAKKILSSELNFLFGNFEIININAVSFIENYLYLKRLLQELNPTPFFVSFCVNTVGANTMYYDRIASAVKPRYHPDETTVIVDAYTDILANTHSYFYQRFLSRLFSIKERSKEYTAMIRLLLAISKGYIRKKELGTLKVCQGTKLLTLLQKLREWGYIYNNGDVYKIKDELFSFWLSHIFCHSFELTFARRVKLATVHKQKINESVELFKRSFYEDKMKRILELINLFNNETLRVGNDRIRLPHIERTKLISYPERNLHFLIGEGKEIICAAIKEETADDADIYDYIEKTNVLHKKNVKRIFITLDRFTSSARFIARENKLVAWDINEINRLFKIYGKPIIINESTGIV